MKTIFLINTDTDAELNDLIDILEDCDQSYLIYETAYAKFIKETSFLLKLENIRNKILFIRKKNPSFIIGGPSIENRIISLITKKKFICYLRCLHPNPNNLTSFFDRLNYLLLKLNININLVNPYHAHHIITTSDINISFLEKRKISCKEIYNIGAIWLSRLDNKKNSKYNKNNRKPRIYYISEAYKKHLMPVEDENQDQEISYLSSINFDQYDFYIRKHPNDTNDYIEVNISQSRPYDFIADEINIHDVFISKFSTLAFEIISIGNKVIFLNYKDEKNNSLYKKYKIKTYELHHINTQSLSKLGNNDLPCFISKYSKEKTKLILNKLKDARN